MSETAQASADESAVKASKVAVAAINRFAAAHGDGARAVLEYVGTNSVRIALVGADGTFGDIVVPSMELAEAAVEASVATTAEWDRELTSDVKLPAGLRKKMAGAAMPGYLE